MRWTSLPRHRGAQSAACVVLAVGVGVLTNVLTNHLHWALVVALGVLVAAWAALEWVRSSGPDANRPRRVVVNQTVRRLTTGRLLGARRTGDADVTVDQNIGRADGQADIIGVDDADA
ncbi:hypothetical protein SAMN05216489_06969 [Streptomyces sp. 3213]|uniref:hypothetical protein n=1 Tax=Streptomyces sp. 3213.3 TaxID=1855348 RepID=UPI00089C8381|nr:hypothetical protein [Streptomyces sp. 3213.3]SEE52752.1 hypothetical protein SAMN05216489_06969 [Streptomyces sp. 3213] [Streptomyces sp. 3213.3]